ncbi:MAG TPA: ATP-binding protein [Verrucomicrobiota bacterium]|nr:ATP-binding protein [Verrucomicrobiota bacterium]
MSPWLTLLLLLASVGVTFWIWRRERAAKSDLAESRRELEGLRHAQRLRLAEEETKQQAVFNSMVEGLLILDERGRVQFANPALGHLFSQERDIRGQTLLEAFRLHELQSLAQRAVSEGRVTGIELRLPGEDAQVVQVNAAVVRDTEHALAGTILVFHDLTRIKQLERVRQEFVANVSHELRTPLSLIKGYVETLLDGAKDDPAVSTRFLHTIEKHADRLTFLIDDLLAIAQLESGQVALNLQSLDLRDQAEQVVNDLSSRAAERQVTLRNEIPAGLLIRADGDRIQQVLFNLVDNAVKYGRPGGEVRLGGRADGGQWIEGWVADNGPGIPVEARERIFERFYRVDRARSREQGGTGLGLSIVKHIIQSHGGEVHVESTPGQGATFSYTLPQANASDSPSQ